MLDPGAISVSEGAQLTGWALFAFMAFKELVKSVVDAYKWTKNRQNRRTEKKLDDCLHEDRHENDGEMATKLLVNRKDFGKLIDGIASNSAATKTNTEVLKNLLESYEDKKRILHRVEGRLDYFDRKLPAS